MGFRVKVEELYEIGEGRGYKYIMCKFDDVRRIYYFIEVVYLEI